MLEGAESIGIKLTHVYGLTEVYGPASVCAEQPGWDELSPEARAQMPRVMRCIRRIGWREGSRRVMDSVTRTMR